MIRPIKENDFDSWRELWIQYLRFYRAELTEETTRHTFERLTAERDELVGLVAVGKGSDLVGFAHLVFHPSTWSERPYCYLEDLFVSRSVRGGSVAKELISAVYQEADRQKAARVYWHTQQYNGAARSVFDQIAHPTSFVVYQR